MLKTYKSLNTFQLLRKSAFTSLPFLLISFTAWGDAGPANSESVQEMITKGSISGNLRLHSYSRHNAFLSPGLNQDTTAYGGSIKFETARYEGVSAGIGAIFARTIDNHKAPNNIDDLSEDQNNLGELYLSYSGGPFKITAGNQRMNLPFAGDYDYRITPTLYQGVLTQIGDERGALTFARVFRFMPQGEDSFNRRTMYDQPYNDAVSTGKKTNGLWALGLEKSQYSHDNEVDWRGKAWFEKYEDYTDIYYLEGHATFLKSSFNPSIGVQYFRGRGEGKEILGDINSTSWGMQFSLDPDSFLWTLNYNYITSHPNSYRNGTLVTPYAENVVSSPYFAQPFFTNTKAGAGRVYSTDLSHTVTQRLTLGSV